LVGLALLLAPAWFFATIGPYAPFNRHYMGDLGSFLLPLGLGLLWAAFNPARHRALLAVAAGGNILHALNHIYDAVLAGASLEHWLVDTLPLVLAALLLLPALWPPTRVARESIAPAGGSR
jgi:hypothetical protein